MNSNYFLSPLVLVFILNFYNGYSGKHQVQARTTASVRSLQGFFNSMEDDNNPSEFRHRRTSIIYLDPTEGPVKRRRTRKKKLYKVIKRVIEIKKPAKFSAQPGHQRDQKHRKDHNEKHKKLKRPGQEEGWKTWKRQKHADNSRMSSSKSQEGEKRNPVDIIVHIKMKE